MVYKLPDEVKGSKKEEDVGFFESALAGVATGLWNIPKGFVSLGAEIFDLVGDTDTAKNVEKWFDDVNPFDDEAEARTVGKITQALTQIAPVAVSGAILGARVGKSLAKSALSKATKLQAAQLGAAGTELGYTTSKINNAQKIARRALAAKKAGKSFSLYNAGNKIMGPMSGGVIGGGLGEAVVADEEIGTLADIAKGTSFEPYALTMLDRDETKEGREDAYRKLKNRLKFGTEGALFNLALLGAGKGIQKLRKPSETGVKEYSESTLGRALQKIRLGLSPQRGGNRQTLEMAQTASGNIGAIEFGAGKAVKEFEEALGGVFKPLKNYFMKLNEGLSPKFIGPKTAVLTEEKMLEKIFKILTPEGKTQSLLKTEAKERAIKQAKSISSIQSTIRKNTLEKIPLIKNQLDDINRQLLQKPQDTSLLQLQKKLTDQLRSMQNIKENVETAFRNNKGLFKVKDYQLNDELKNIISSLKKAGIKNTKPFEKSILNFRMSVDNMSGKLLQGGSLSQEAAETIESQLGNYLTREYKQYNRLNPLKKWQVTAETRAISKDKLLNHKLQQFEREQIQKGFVDKDGKALNKPNASELRRMDELAEKQIDDHLKTKSIDEADVQSKNFKGGPEQAIEKATKEEIESVSLNSTILEKRILEPWQSELAGVIKDPRYTFYSTINKQSNLNYTLKYMDDINKTLSVGPNKAIFTKEELLAAGKGSELNNPLKWKYVEPKTGKLTGMSALDGKYVQAPMYDAIFDVTSNWLNQSNVGMAYRYMILAPKALSQIAKTVLSPVTHVRNFLSASAFAAANGAILPSFSDIKTLAPTMLGGKGILGQAYDLTGKRLLGTMTKADDALYKRLRRLSVVDSNVIKGENLRILNDLRGGEAGAKAMRKLSDLGGKKGQKIYSKIQDAYVAEDDFWKIVSWNLERNRYDGVLSKLGINESNYKSILSEESARGKYFRKMTPRTEIAGESFEGFLDEIAGNMVRNQVPNYNYVGTTAKALRQSPFGNFIAFPLEIMRTGNNIMTQAVEEITSGVPGLRNIGIRRLGSFGLTVGGIPAGLVATFKAKNNVTDEEMSALRKFVPEWSENSTLLPVGRDKDGYLKYIDFSYTNPYDSLMKPFRSIMNSISEKEITEGSLKSALGEGMTEGMVELMQPFMSESIFTEALIDSTFRRGIGKGGKKIWSEADDPMVRISKGVLHVAESLTPGSISQMKRISQAATGKTDKYGNLYNLQDELPGIAGFRSIQSNPVKSLQFMTTNFGSELKKSENLFTSPLLRGGRVSSKDILKGYKYSESRRFQALREMYQNIEAARSLGVPEYKIREKVKRKGLSKDLLNNLFQGVYTPKKPSSFFITRMNEINRDLNEKENVNLPNPYFEALPNIIETIDKNRRLDLLTDELKIFNEEDIQPDVLLNNQTSSISNSNPVINSQITGAPISPDSLVQQANNQIASIPYSQMNTQQKLQYDKDTFNNR